MEKIVAERPGTRIYKSLEEWGKEHPDCSPLDYAFVALNFKERKELVQNLFPVVG